MSSTPSPNSVDAVRAALGGPSDVSGLERLAREGRLDPDAVVAVTGKTEGTEPDETTRVDADRAIRRFLLDSGTRSAEEIARIPMVFTSGGVGILTPHIVAYSRCEAEPVAGSPRLAIGTARSAIMQPEWAGSSRVIDANAAAMRAAIADSGMTASEVEYLIGKAYHVPIDEIDAARAAGRAIPPLDARRLFLTTSGSAGLAAAAVLDGVAAPPDDDIARDLSRWSAKASFSANPWEPVGGGGPHTQVIALGNSAQAGGRLRIAHSAVDDLLDVAALPRALRRAGLDVGEGPLTPAQRERVVAVYVKAGPAPEPLLRGNRQVTSNRHYGTELKAAVAGMFAGYLQDTHIYISGSATHQGPPGGGTLAVVVDAG